LNCYKSFISYGQFVTCRHAPLPSAIIFMSISALTLFLRCVSFFFFLDCFFLFHRFVFVFGRIV